MNDEESALQRTLAKLSDVELHEIVGLSGSYEPEAVEFARAELVRRGHTELGYEAFVRARREAQREHSARYRPTLFPARFGVMLGVVALGLELAAVFLWYTSVRGSSADLPLGFVLLVFLDRMIWLAAGLEWLEHVFRIHQDLADRTDGAYPIRPGAAMLGSLVPLVNFFWVLHWTWTLRKYLAETGSDGPLRGFPPGLELFLALLVMPVSPGLGLMLAYGVTARIQRALAAAGGSGATSSMAPQPAV